MNHVSITLFVGILTTGSIFAEHRPAEHPLSEHPKAMKIESNILALADGNPRYIDMAQLMSFQHKVQDILSKKMPTKKMPDCTFKTIVAMEHKLPIHERDSILHKFIAQFEQIIKKHIKDLDKIQEICAELVNRWAHQRNRPLTQLNLLVSLINQEHEAWHISQLQNNLITLHQFDAFLEDLNLFLTDLIVSVPKSFHLYQEALKKVKEHHESTEPRSI